MPQNAEESKWEGQKQTWWLTFHWEVATYHTSTSVDEGRHPLFLSEWPETGAWLGLSFYLPLHLSPGFLYQYADFQFPEMIRNNQELSY
jgi:hypothetical protein